MGEFLEGTTVFADEDVLREDFTPDQILCRDEERREIIATLQSVANGAQPSNFLVYGKAGVGKTVVMKTVLSELKSDMEQVDDVDVRVVWDNCKNEGSSYKTSVSLANQFLSEEQKVPKSGYSGSRVRRELFTAVDNCDATHVLFVLDEIDALGTEDELLYTIPRARDSGEVTDTKLGIIGISNDFSYKNDLSARAKSSLCEKTVHFSGYDAGQLYKIIKQRAEMAFIDDVIDESTLRLISAFAADEDGSARLALDILLQAGHNVRKRHDEAIKEKHARNAYNDIDADVDIEEIASLPVQEVLTLYAVYKLQKAGRTPAPMTEIYELYLDLAKELDKKTRTKRTIHDRTDSLTLSGFLRRKEENEGKMGGRRYMWEIGLSMKDVRAALVQNDTSLGIDSENTTLQQFK